MPPTLQILAEPACARAVMADAAGITHEQAKQAIRALIKAGYVVAPREPTNCMIEAYMTALRSPPTVRRTILENVAKARRRWNAMADAGNRVAMSNKALVGQLEGHRNSTPADAGSSPAERATI